MSYRFTELPWLLNKHPGELKALILKAVRENQGNMTDTAEYLGICRRIAYGYIYKLGLSEQVAEIRDEFRFAKKALGRTPDLSPIGHAVRTNPEKAKQILEWTLADVGGHYQSAATALGISAKRLHQYVRQLGVGRQEESPLGLATLDEAR